MNLNSMSCLQNTLSRQEWLDRTYRKSKSQRTLELAKAALKSFDVFCSERYGKDPKIIIVELRDNPGDRTYIFLNNFVSFMDNKSPKTVQTYFGLVKSFLRTQGVKTDRDDIKEFVKLPTLLKVRRKPLTKEVIRKLLDNSKERRKALYLTLLSSGMRLGEALSLKKMDFDFTKDPVMVSIPASYTKTRESRETFISSEARELVLNLVRDKSESEFVFTHHKDNVDAVRAEEAVFSKLRQRCNLLEKYESGNRFIINIHAFRAYFHTFASRTHGTEYANALDGHTSYLGQYYRIAPEERAKMYKKLEPSLLIYGIIDAESGILEEQLEVKDKEIENLTNLIIDIKTELAKLRKRQERIEKTIKIG